MCVLFSGYILTTSSDKATIGLDFTFTCATSNTFVAFSRDATTVCTITGRNTNGTCVLDTGYISSYTYTCNLTTNTYTVSIPGYYMTDSLHRTIWLCANPFGGGESSKKKLYVNGELFDFKYNNTDTAFVRVFCNAFSNVLGIVKPQYFELLKTRRQSLYHVTLQKKWFS